MQTFLQRLTQSAWFCYSLSSCFHMWAPGIEVLDPCLPLFPSIAGSPPVKPVPNLWPLRCSSSPSCRPDQAPGGCRSNWGFRSSLSSDFTRSRGLSHIGAGWRVVGGSWSVPSGFPGGTSLRGEALGVTSVTSGCDLLGPSEVSDL